jgi:hypothetical protein
MDNPFKKRATEYFDDPAALLSLLSAEPISTFFAGDYEQLFDRSVIVAGAPGSGKTTLAQLMELDTLIALSTNAASGENTKLIAELAHFKVLDNLVPTILAFRLPAGSTLREIWELPYSAQVRSVLLRSFIQARTVLGWLRKLEKANVPPEAIRVVTREHLETVSGLIKADDIVQFKNFAREVETRIFKVVTALVPPAEDELMKVGIDAAYQAFDAIDSFVVTSIPGVSSGEVRLKPLLILDDAHELDPAQFSDVESWLRQRELKIARWIVTRIDAIRPDDLRSALAAREGVAPPGTTPGRDRLFKLMQRDRKDKSSRRAFRAVARDIARRYIEQMPALRRKGMSLENCLEAPAATLSPAELKTLTQKVISLKEKSGLPDFIHKQLEASIPKGTSADVAQAVMRILLHRQMKSTPQTDLFGIEINEGVHKTDEDEDEEDTPGENVAQSDIKTRKASLLTGGRIQLFHEFERPFFYTFNVLADASNDNIEQFINLAGALVDVIETRLLRNSSIRLDAKLQHQTLAKRARETVSAWDFPHSVSVRKVVHFIAEKCLEKTLQPNAPLDDGANTFGVPQAEMDRLHKDGGPFVQVLHFALAYNALSIVENYPCKKRSWCLFELGGLPIIAAGLTLGRGGFCEGHLTDLMECVAHDG